MTLGSTPTTRTSSSCVAPFGRSAATGCPTRWATAAHVRLSRPRQGAAHGRTSRSPRPGGRVRRSRRGERPGDAAAGRDDCGRRRAHVTVEIWHEDDRAMLAARQTTPWMPTARTTNLRRGSTLTRQSPCIERGVNRRRRSTPATCSPNGHSNGQCRPAPVAQHGRRDRAIATSRPACPGSAACSGATRSSTSLQLLSVRPQIARNDAHDPGAATRRLKLTTGATPSRARSCTSCATGELAARQRDSAYAVLRHGRRHAPVADAARRVRALDG